MPVAPRTPQGVLELLPAQQIAFQRMVDTIRRGFERFGYLPIETPSFELTDILLTKSGGETEKQVYFVQSTGALGAADGKRPELALRFDLTVPLARYVAEHEHALNFPFRRYQIQRVYRGERAQKGRFREFYQCDIDVVGKDTLALAHDVELPAVIYGIFRELAFGKFTIYINNRKLLKSLLEANGVAGDAQTAVLHEIDRLRKVGRPKVEELLAPLVTAAQTKALLDVLTADWAAIGKELALDGAAELQRVYDGTLALGVPAAALKVDLSIVRGLDYYTGTVYETFLDAHPEFGSICSGGRYDNLAEHYTKSKLPGVGISIGLTRLFSQLLDAEERALKDKRKPDLDLSTAHRAIARAIVLNVDASLALDYARLAAELRAAGINTEVYGGDDKLGKQFKYADRGGVPIAVICGSREHAAGVVKLKDLRITDTSIANEHEVPRGEVVARVKQLLG